MGAKQGKALDKGSVAVPLRALPVGGPLGTWGNLWEAPGGPADLQIPIGPGPRATYAPQASKFTYVRIRKARKPYTACGSLRLTVGIITKLL